MTAIIKQEEDDKYLIKGHFYLIQTTNGFMASAIDLTLRFGKGNEPTDINDERIKDLFYKPHTSVEPLIHPDKKLHYGPGDYLNADRRSK